MPFQLSKIDIKKVQERYTARHKTHGNLPETLGWNKGRQIPRFQSLTGSFSLQNISVLDIGCGFGDLIPYLEKHGSIKSYLGIDLVPSLITDAQNIHKEEKYKFKCCDFLATEIDDSFDLVLGSGIFNFKLESGNNWDFITTTLEKAFKLSTTGISFNFLSDQVDYEKPLNYHSSPKQVLDFSYSLTKRLILRNDLMPFEFTLTLFKDQSPDRESGLFKPLVGLK